MKQRFLTRQSLVDGIKNLRKDAEAGHGTGHGAASSSVTVRREADHKGHRIEVLAEYRILVDGNPVNVRFDVDNAGRVTCHAVPNYVTVSAVDLVKRLIDAFPESFASTTGGSDGGGGHHAHEHGPRSAGLARQAPPDGTPAGSGPSSNGKAAGKKRGARKSDGGTK